MCLRVARIGKMIKASIVCRDPNCDWIYEGEVPDKEIPYNSTLLESKTADAIRKHHIDTQRDIGGISPMCGHRIYIATFGDRTLGDIEATTHVVRYKKELPKIAEPRTPRARSKEL